MPNIAVVLKEEIARLARKELRSQTEGMKKASTMYRREIAGLKKQVTRMERQIALLEGKVFGKKAALPADVPKTRVRFTAKGLRSHRKRLGLSASDYARLVGVTPQSIYNWERETSSPRKEQIAVIANLRGIGKKEARARLAVLAEEEQNSEQSDE